MENVPRLATIMERELCQEGVLHRFAGLNPRIMVLDASEWGVRREGRGASRATSTLTSSSPTVTAFRTAPSET